MWHFRGNSDRDWVASRMRVIPEHLRAEVAQGYDKIYMPSIGVRGSTGRKDANEYLDKIARQYKDEVKPKLVNPRNAERNDDTNVPRNKRAAQSKCGLWSKNI